VGGPGTPRPPFGARWVSSVRYGVCVFIAFITAGPIVDDRPFIVYKAVRGGGRRRVEGMCYDGRRAEACVDESAHHALV
jgi:hypothetical protein